MSVVGGGGGGGGGGMTWGFEFPLHHLLHHHYLLLVVVSVPFTVVPPSLCFFYKLQNIMQFPPSFLSPPVDFPAHLFMCLLRSYYCRYLLSPLCMQNCSFIISIHLSFTLFHVLIEHPLHPSLYSGLFKWPWLYIIFTPRKSFIGTVWAMSL